MTADARQLIQPWTCDRCGRRGTLRLPAHVGAWEAIEAILAAHRGRAPRCRGDAGTVRILKPRKVRR